MHDVLSILSNVCMSTPIGITEHVWTYWLTFSELGSPDIIDHSSDEKKIDKFWYIKI